MCARNNLYVISVENGTVSRLTTTEGVGGSAAAGQTLQEVAQPFLCVVGYVCGF